MRRMTTNATLGDVISTRRWTTSAPNIFEWMAELLRAEGVDISRASVEELQRGTPVYARAQEDLSEVGRLMAHHHIRRIPVLDKGKLLGLVDIVELALHSEHVAGVSEDEAG